MCDGATIFDCANARFNFLFYKQLIHDVAPRGVVGQLVYGVLRGLFRSHKYPIADPICVLRRGIISIRAKLQRERIGSGKPDVSARACRA